MFSRLAADVVLVLHFAFVLFVIFGGVLALRWRQLAWVHIPVALYGAAIEFLGFVCPLTPLENSLRERGGQAGYRGGFIEHYITAAIYPNGLTRDVQFWLGAGVLALNAIVYTIWVRGRRTGVGMGDDSPRPNEPAARQGESARPSRRHQPHR